MIKENIKNNALKITTNKLHNKKLSKYFLKSNLRNKITHYIKTFQYQKLFLQ